MGLMSDSAFDSPRWLIRHFADAPKPERVAAKEMPRFDLPHDCHQHLVEVDHRANRVDWSGPNSSQSYQVYVCGECGTYWGVRYQWDAGTGHDDRRHKFGPDIEAVKRHY